MIEENPLFPKLSNSKAGIAEILSNPVDHKALLAAETDPDKRVKHSMNVAMRRGAQKVSDDLDKVFKELLS